MNKIEELKKQFEDGDEESKAEIDNWDIKLRKSRAFIELRKNECIQIIINEYKKKIDKINDDLLNKKELENRDLLMAERNWRKEFINYFVSAENEVKEINKLIDENLE